MRLLCVWDFHLPKLCLGRRLSPLHVLRPYLLHLGDSKRLTECYGQLLETLRPISTDDCSKTVIIPSWGSGDVSAELREQFRISLATHLYGWDEIMSLRMRLSLADFAWVRDPVRRIISLTPCLPEINRKR